MCNLLIPLCPFVLHSVAASDSSAAYISPPDSSTDAKILFSYLSKRPYQPSDSPPSQSRNYPTPLSLPSLKLYKRINWHTCPCIFNQITVLHPRPGPSRPTFGCAGKSCRRCSLAARVLRPMRRGGPTDRSTRHPYWNRCMFLGADGVFEPEDNEACEDLRSPQPMQNRPAQVQQHAEFRQRTYDYGEHLERSPSQNDDGYGQKINGRVDEVPSHAESGRASQRNPGSRPRSRYQADLKSYLAETYGEQG